MRENNRQTGGKYERLIAEYLEKQGMKILEANYRCRSGEIDLVAADGRFLVFVEVKYRKNRSMGSALEAVTLRKAAQVRRTAEYYLFEKRLPEDTPCRFDAAAVDGEIITYLKNAF